MPSFSQKSLEKLSTCHPDLQRLLKECIKYVDFTILEGHRGEEAQNEAFKKGNSTLKWPDGKHNKLPSIAVDVAPWPVDFNNTARFYMLIGFIRGVASQLGIKVRVGADWDGDFETTDQKLVDLPHVELL